MNQTDNVYIPQSGGTTGITPSYPVRTYPNVCPGCGRCKDCGHPVQPYVPYMPSYPLPQITYGQVTLESKNVVALNQQQ